LAACCADPQAVIDLVRRAQIHVVMGNCEESVASGERRPAAVRPFPTRTAESPAGAAPTALREYC
jgi:hypothetical protein